MIFLMVLLALKQLVFNNQNLIDSFVYKLILFITMSLKGKFVVIIVGKME